MLAVPADRLPAALADLDPGNRALLDLSLRRGVSDGEIGELLRKEPAAVARGRDAVLELLADVLDVDGHDRSERVRLAIAALPDDAWNARSATAAAPPPPPEPPVTRPPRPLPPRDPERAAAARELDDRIRFEPAPEPERSRRGRLLAVLGILAILGVLLALILSGGDDEDSNESGSQPTPSQKQPSPAPKGDTAELAPLGGGRGEGTVTVTDEGATIMLRGLPNPSPGSYQVWLYDSIVKSKSLGTVPGGKGKLEVQLPPDAAKYKYLDVSKEPDDANPNHSGASVMRAPLDGLL
jgi:hypothetical protein